MEASDHHHPVALSKVPHRGSSRAAEEPLESNDKYRRYEKEYLRRINYKYFSGATFTGEPVYESQIVIDGFIFKESKDPPLKKFTEGQSSHDDHGKGGIFGGDAAPPSAWKSSMRKN